MSISVEDLSDEFQLFGVELDDEEITDKLTDLCQQYGLDAGAIAAEWVAFSHTKSCKLTQENLDHMERDRLAKKGKKVPKTPVAKKVVTPVYDLDTLEEMTGAEGGDDILDLYNTPRPKGQNKRMHTPENPVNKRVMGVGKQASTPTAPFSPASFSPASATPSKKYSSRTNAGEVVCTHGAVSGGDFWKNKRTAHCSLAHHNQTVPPLSSGCKYMFQKLTEKRNVLNALIEDMESYLQEKHKIEDWSNIALPVQDQATVCGRIGCDSDGKLNAKSVVVEGSLTTSAGRHIALDLDQAPSYSLFPGQVVAMDGLNSTGSKFVAKKVYESVPQPLPDTPPELDGALSVVIATGPYTTSDSTMYEPLADLIKYLQRNPPDICIMMGPFLDVKHADIEKNLGEETFETFFRRTIDQIVSATGRMNTQLVFVPSHRDIHHEFVYPQPPYAITLPDNKKVHFMPDPCMLSIDGVVFGITSTDIIFHLGAEEISRQAGPSDRLSRLASHTIEQHNFYPLYPPAEEMNVDYELFELHAHMDVTPHVLVLPSDLRQFIKDLNGCCCVNPGRLTKGQIGGTYARMVIKPGSAEKGSIIKNITAQVLRI